LAGLSKLNSVSRHVGAGIEVDVVPGESVCLDGLTAIDSREAEAERPFNRADAYRSKSSGIP
jgi:hypothetical protein